MTEITDFKYTPRIICAANRRRTDDALLVGPRHWDSTMLHQMAYLREGTDDFRLATWEQGFIDQMGVFYTRTEAWKIAEALGQIKRRVGGDTTDGGTLYSENLY